MVDGESGFIAGHGRVTAARNRDYIPAYYNPAEQAGWNNTLLALELGDLQDIAVDLTSLSLKSCVLDALLRSGEANPRADDFPEPPALPVSRPSNLSLLCNHRLIRGDAMDAATVARVLNGVHPHLMATEPAADLENCCFGPTYVSASGLLPR